MNAEETPGSLVMPVVLPSGLIATGTKSQLHFVNFFGPLMAAQKLSTNLQTFSRECPVEFNALIALVIDIHVLAIAQTLEDAEIAQFFLHTSSLNRGLLAASRYTVKGTEQEMHRLTGKYELNPGTTLAASAMALELATWVGRAFQRVVCAHTLVQRDIIKLGDAVVAGNVPAARGGIDLLLRWRYRTAKHVCYAQLLGSAAALLKSLHLFALACEAIADSPTPLKAEELRFVFRFLSKVVFRGQCGFDTIAVLRGQGTAILAEAEVMFVTQLLGKLQTSRFDPNSGIDALRELALQASQHVMVEFETRGCTIVFDHKPAASKRVTIGVVGQAWQEC